MKRSGKISRMLMPALLISLGLSGCGTTMYQKMLEDNDRPEEIDTESEAETETQAAAEEVESYQFQLICAGTIDLSEDATNMDTYRFYESNLSQCISETFRNTMKAADLCIANVQNAEANEITEELGIDFDIQQVGEKSFSLIESDSPENGDITETIAQIAEASETVDFVVVYVNWDSEGGYEIRDTQTEIAHAYIDAGADAVIGTDSYVVQGIEIYEKKPICYSLGNFWSDAKSGDTMLLSLTFSGTDEEANSVKIQILPGIRAGGRSAYLNKADEQLEFFEKIAARSINVEIDENGYAYERESR
ncbi:MAG: hypothetical protein E7282_06805 [Lachnospiraceae bacterium]|nr:hypothetical protein [Lachnospiraceae bacterium]